MYKSCVKGYTNDVVWLYIPLYHTKWEYTIIPYKMGRYHYTIQNGSIPLCNTEWDDSTMPYKMGRLDVPYKHNKISMVYSLSVMPKL